MPYPFVLAGALGLGFGLASCTETREIVISPPETPEEPQPQPHPCNTQAYSRQFHKKEGTTEYTLVVHRLMNDNGSGGHTRFDIDQALKGLNAAYAPMKIKFKMLPLDDIKDSNAYLTRYSGALTLENLMRLRYGKDYQQLSDPLITQGIHVFLVDSIDGEGGHAVQTMGFVAGTYSGSFYTNIWIHEIGHVFGLIHPHDKTFGKELADGSNCSTAGDLLCDTPADPHSSTFSSDLHPHECVVQGCKIVSCPTDESGKSPKPDVGLYMGYYSECADHFSPQEMDVVRCFEVDAMAEKSRISSQYASITPQTMLNVGCDPKAPSTLDNAIRDASDGATITVCDGNYALNGILLRERNLTLSGDATKPAGTGVFLANANTASLFTLLNHSTLTLKNMAGVFGISSHNGGVITAVSSKVVLENVTAAGRALGEGGCLWLYDADVTLTNSHLRKCSSFMDGGAIFADQSHMTIINSSFDGNRSDSVGGAFYLRGTKVSAEKTIFDRNQAEYAGGAVYLRGSQMTLKGGAIVWNSSHEYTGSAAVSLDQSTFIFSGTTWSEMAFFNIPYDIGFIHGGVQPYYVGMLTPGDALTCSDPKALCQ